MKKLFTAFMVMALTAAAFPLVSSASIDKKDAYKAYKKWIVSSENSKYNEYKLLDINKDGVNELIASYYDKNFCTYQYTILTFDGKKVNTKEVRSGVASAGGFRGSASIDKSNGYIIENTMWAPTCSGYDYITVIKKGKFVQKVSLVDVISYNSVGNVQMDKYSHNDKKISKSEYAKLLKKYFSKKTKDLETIKYVSRSRIKKQLNK